MRVKHVSLFEAVKLESGEEDRSLDQVPIQKIISVPVAPSGGLVMGVVQVSRKGWMLRSQARISLAKISSYQTSRRNSRPHALHAGRRGDLGFVIGNLGTQTARF